MTDSARVRRHAERVKELVASVVRTQIKDPRLGMITITDSRITGDLREATVFYTVLGDSAAQAGTAAALDSANGLLRSTVGKALGLRHSPTLTFVLDDVQDQVKHLDELLAAAREADAEVHRIAANARHAGDPQPYRLDDEDEFDEDGDEDSPAEPAVSQSGGLVSGGPASGGLVSGGPASGGPASESVPRAAANQETR